MPGYTYVFEAVPLTEFVEPYLQYVTDQSASLANGDAGLSRKMDPAERDIVSASMEVGRACEYALIGEDRQANRILGENTGSRLRPYISADGGYPPSIARKARSLRLIAELVISRDKPDALEQIYSSIHRSTVTDIELFEARLRRLVGRNRRNDYDDLDGPAGVYAGSHAERVIESVLTRPRLRKRREPEGGFSLVHGSLVLPALPHLDQSLRPHLNHDMVLVAKHVDRPPVDKDEILADKRDIYFPYEVQRVQIKRRCLALGQCATNLDIRSTTRKLNKLKLRTLRNGMQAGMVICSAHCDLGGESDSLTRAAQLVVGEYKATLGADEKMELHNITRHLEGPLMEPGIDRLGRLAPGTIPRSNGHRSGGNLANGRRV